MNNDNNTENIIPEKPKLTNSKIEILKHEAFNRLRKKYGLEDILNVMIDINASDVHLTSNEPISMTFRKEILKTPFKTRPDEIQSFVAELTHSNAGLMKIYKPEEIDGSYVLRNYDTDEEFFFRYNIGLAMTEPDMTIRKLINEIPTFEYLQLTEEKGLPFVNEILNLNNGIYLVVGETGSGKTTTLVSIIDKIMKMHSVKVITLEAPIEFYYKPSNYKDSIIKQKEIGRDTMSFLTGLRAAMRQAPDVILVGEIRDKETAIAALQASQSGHMVLGTLHANGPIDAKDRLFNMLEGQNGFENSLRGAMFQKLYKDLKTGGVEVIRNWEIFNHED